jgi:hypothetical protein
VDADGKRVLAAIRFAVIADANERVCRAERLKRPNTSGIARVILGFIIDHRDLDGFRFIHSDVDTLVGPVPRLVLISRCPLGSRTE